MDVPRPSSAARRSTTSIPAKPDASLAEWTSKIKAMQKQVDEDEDAETRRLEAEIAASRQARMRRSTNLGSRTNSIDLCESNVSAEASECLRFCVLRSPKRDCRSNQGRRPIRGPRRAIDSDEQAEKPG